MITLKYIHGKIDSTFHFIVSYLLGGYFICTSLFITFNNVESSHTRLVDRN